MKIAFINQPWNFCPSDRAASVSIWTHEVARRLAKQCDVTVYARMGPGQPSDEIRDGIRFRRLSVRLDHYFLDQLNRLKRLGLRTQVFASRFYYLGYVLRLAWDLKRQGYDIIHVHNLSQFVPILAWFNPDARIVLHMHCQWLTQIPRATISARLRRTHGIIACSEFLTEKIRAAFPEYANRCATIYNGVDIEQFEAEDRTTYDADKESARLIFVGRVTPEKGLHTMLQALAELRNRHPKISLSIVGPPATTPREFIADLVDAETAQELLQFYQGRPYLEQLRETVKSLGLEDAVRFVGLVQPSELPPYYRGYDLFVNPSFSEGLPLTILEAMATGVTAVATPVGGTAEAVVHGETGLLVPPGDVAALSRAISELIEDESLRLDMARAARERVLSCFSWQVIAKDLLNFYGMLDEF